MQQHCISAHIVTNPSTLKRNSDLNAGDSTFFESHHVFPRFDPIPSLSSHGQHTASVPNVCMSSDACISGGYVCSLDPSSTFLQLEPCSRAADGSCASDETLLLDTTQVLTHAPIRSRSGPNIVTTWDLRLPASKYPSPPSSEGDASVTCLDQCSPQLLTNHSQASLGLSSAGSSSHGYAPFKLSTPGSPTARGLYSAPSLLKENAKQFTYVESLVEIATTVTRTLWPTVSGRTSSSCEDTNYSVGMIKYFITETSRKSKTSLSTMQLALLYCIQYKRAQDRLALQGSRTSSTRGTVQDSKASSYGSTCARRNFLSALILASKYLQDRNFSNKAWSKISSVSVAEINLRERDFLATIGWNLHVEHEAFAEWSNVVEHFIAGLQEQTVFGGSQVCQSDWKNIVRKMVLLPGTRMSDVVRALSFNPLPDEIAQLCTPAATPIEEKDEAMLVPGASLPAIPMPVNISQEPLSCLAFEEYGRAMSRDSSVHLSDPWTDSSDAKIAGEYMTPESMRINSPSSSHCDTPQMSTSVSQAELRHQTIHNHDYTQPSLVKDPTFYLQHFLNATTQSSLGQERVCKRSASIAGCTQDTGCANFAQESMQPMKRRRLVLI